MPDIALGLSVNQWNIIKFVLIEVFVSAGFSSIWNLFIQRVAAYKLRNNEEVCISQSVLGRFTPAEVGIRSTNTARGPNNLHNWTSRAYLPLANLVLFALIFVLEYGSTDTLRTEWTNSNVVTAQSVAQNTIHVAEQAPRTVVLPASVTRGFDTSTRRALRVLQSDPGNYSIYELREHVLDDKRRLNRPKVIAIIYEVCGDNAATNIPHCERVLAPFLKLNKERRIFARITKHHAFGGDGNHSMYDVTLLRSQKGQNGEIVDLRQNQIMGTCHGEPYLASTFGRRNQKEFTLGTTSCVLYETVSERVFLVFPKSQGAFKLAQHRDEVSMAPRPNGEGPWVPVNGTILLETAPNSILSFKSTLKIDTYTAALAMVPQGTAYRDMAKDSLGLAVFREYRRHVLLLCLGLFGKYYENRRVQITLQSHQAAINIFFVAGLVGLLLFTFVLGMASLSLGKATPLLVPVEMRRLLHDTRKVACENEVDGNWWPEFKVDEHDGRTCLFPCGHIDTCTCIERNGSNFRVRRPRLAANVV